MATKKDKTTEVERAAEATAAEGTASPLRAEVERKAGALIDEVVERAVASIEETEGREEVRATLGGLLRDTWVELAEDRAERARALARTASSRDLSPDALAAGTGAFLGFANDTGFANFTCKLITDTIDAIVSATIRQMEAYADLVANLAKTLWEFEREAIGDAEVVDFLVSNFPDGEGGTVVRTDFDYAADGADPEAAKKKLRQTWANLKTSVPFLGRSGTFQGQAIDFTVNEPGEDDTGFGFLMDGTDDQVELKVKPAISASLARRTLDTLRTMASEGMDRIGITDGKIRTRVTFKVNTVDRATRDDNLKSTLNLSHSSSVSLPLKWISISASTSNSLVRVRTINETNFNEVTMNAEMIGEVELRFRSEKFATIEPPALPPLPPVSAP